MVSKRLKLLITPISTLFFCACLTTPGDVKKEQELSDRISNIEVNTANALQAIEELKLEHNKTKGQLEKLEYVLNQKIEEIKVAQAGVLKPEPVKIEVSNTDVAKATEGVKATDVAKAEDTTDKAEIKTTEATTKPLVVGTVDERYKAARKFQDAKEYDEAEKYYNSLLVEKSAWYDEKARFSLGYIYSGQGKYKESIVALQEFIDKYPKSRNVPPAILAQGDSFVSLKQKKEAEVFYKDLIVRYPKTKEAERAKSRLKKL